MLNLLNFSFQPFPGYTGKRCSCSTGAGTYPSGISCFREIRSLGIKKMRTGLFILVLTGFFQMQSLGQPDAAYNGPAKTAVKSFWDFAEKVEKANASGGSALTALNLATMERKLKEISSKDPAYPIGPLETRLKELKSGADRQNQKTAAAVQAGKESGSIARRVGQLLSELFSSSLQLSSYNAKNAPGLIEAYRNKTAELLGLDRSRNQSDLEKSYKILLGNFNHAENDLAELDRRCREQTNGDNALVQYYELHWNQAHWDAAQQLYPEETSFKTAYALATKLVEGLGTVENLYRLAAQSREEKIKNCRLPAAAVQDPALEKLFIETFNKFHGEEFKGTAIKAVITSEAWSIQRNELTGIILGRFRRAVIVYKNKEGKCFLSANFFIRQEYTGSGYSQLTQSPYPVMGSQEMLCVNAK